MPNTIQFLGTSLPNFKAVKVSPGDNVASLEDKVISIGFGNTLISNTGWDAEAFAALWLDAGSSLFSEVAATAQEDGSLLLTHTTSGADFELTVLIDGGELQVSTLQQILFSPVPTGGSFTLSDGTLTTAAINWNATPATLVTNMQNAINALAGYTAGDVVVTSLGGDAFQLDFSTGRFSGLPVSLWTVNGSSLTGGTAAVNIATTQQGNAGTDAVIDLSFGVEDGFTESESQTITLSGTILEGTTFQVSLDEGSTWSEPVPYYGTGADLLVAIQGLTPEDVRVYGQAGGPYQVIFGDNTDHPTIEVQVNNTSGGTVSNTVYGVLTHEKVFTASNPSTSGSPYSLCSTSAGTESELGNTQGLFERFTIADVPHLAVIEYAELNIRTATDGVFNLLAQFDKDDVSPSIPADGGGNLPTFDASGTVAGNYVAGEYITVPMRIAIQALVNTAGWVAGNAVVLTVSEDSSSTLESVYNKQSATPPTLRVIYASTAPTTDLSANVTVNREGGTVPSSSIDAGEFNLTITAGEASYHVNNLAYDIDASDLQAAIEAVIDTGAVVVTGGPAPDNTFTLSFGGVLQKQPITISAVTSFDGVFSGAIIEEVKRTYTQPATADNVWDLEICPGQGTLGVDPSLSGTHNFVVITITEPLDQLSDVTVQTSATPSVAQQKIYVRLYNINAMRIQRAINETYGADVCRVTRVTHSHEWRRILPPVGVSAGFDFTQPFYCWYYRDIFRVVFVNRFAAADTIVQVEVTPAPVSSVDATLTKPDAWMIPSNAIPDTALPYDLADEKQRTYLGFTMMMDEADPLHIFNAYRCPEEVSNLLAYKYKLAAQWGNNAPTDYSGITTQIVGYKMNFRWVRLTKNNDDESDTEAVLAISEDIDWDATAEQIEAAIEAMDAAFADNVVVTGSLYNSWKPETFTDLDSAEEDYSDLLVELTHQLAHLPLNEHSYELRIGFATSSLQYPTDTSYTREVTLLQDTFSVPLPPFKNLRLGYEILNADAVESFQVAYLDSVVTLPTSSTPAAIETAINGLLGSLASTIIPEKFTKSVKVYGVPLSTGMIEIEFTGLGGQQAGTPNGFLLGSGSIALLNTTTAGVSPLPEIESLTVSGNPFGGTYTLTATPGTTGALAYNANAATIQTALRLLTGYVSVTVTGTYPSFTVTFPSSLGNVVQLTSTPSMHNGVGTLSFIQVGGPDSQLAIFDAVPGRGPSYYEVAENYDLALVPGIGDTLVYDNAVAPVLYGIDQVSVFKVASISDSSFRHQRNRKVFANGQKVSFTTSGVAPNGLVDGTDYFVVNADDTYKFQLSATFGGSPVAITSVGSGTHTLAVESVEIQVFNRYAGDQIGLPIRRSNTTLEYLPRYLHIPGMNVTFGFSGDEGNNVNMFCGDTGDLASNIIVNQAGQGLNSQPPILLLFNNTASTLVINDGDVGVAYFSGESSLLDSIVQMTGDLIMTNTTCNTITASPDADQQLRNCVVNQILNI